MWPPTAPATIRRVGGWRAPRSTGRPAPPAHPARRAGMAPHHPHPAATKGRWEMTCGCRGREATNRDMGEHAMITAALVPPTLPGVATPPHDDAALVEALRRGDEAAFATLLDRYHGRMVRAATLYIGDRNVAEVVAQEAWPDVFRGLEQPGERPALGIRIFRALLDHARSRAQRAAQFAPGPTPQSTAGASGAPAVDPARFYPADHPRHAHRWAVPPRDWGEVIRGQSAGGTV